MKTKILIAYDGSDCARDAIDDLRLAGLPEEAEAVVMSVANVWLPPPSSYELVESAFEDQIRASGGMKWKRCEQTCFTA